jgi:hypothetical protein
MPIALTLLLMLLMRLPHLLQCCFAIHAAGSGQVDLVTNAMDQGCCFGYGFCQKRLNAFWTVLPMGHTVEVRLFYQYWFACYQREESPLR